MEPFKVLQHLECTFVFAAVWSLGGTGASNADRATFEQFFQHALSGTLPEYVGPSGERWGVGQSGTPGIEPQQKVGARCKKGRAGVGMGMGGG